MSIKKHNITNFAIVLDNNGGIKNHFEIENLSSLPNQSWINLNAQRDGNVINFINKFNFFDENIKSVLEQSINQNRIIFGTKDNALCICMHGSYSANEIISLIAILSDNTLITIQNSPSEALDKTLNDLSSNLGAKNISELFLLLFENIFEKIYYHSYQISEKIDDLEAKLIKAKSNPTFDNSIYKLRKNLIDIHRYIVPQKAIFKTITDDVTLFSDSRQKTKLREICEVIDNIVGSAEYSRDHILAIKEEIENNININMNNNMYIITIIIAIFTPISLLIDIVGIDLGVVFNNTEYALEIVCAMICVLAFIMFLTFKKFRIK